MQRRFWEGLKKDSSVFGFGCWQIAGSHNNNGIPNGWGNVENNQAIDLLCYAMENGINFYDTAQGYNSGHSERLLGEAIKKTRKEVIVCTKVALTDKEIFEEKIGLDFKYRVLKSIENLSTTFIDIVLIHNPPDNLNWKAFDYEIIQELIEDKTIGTFGVSSKGLKGAINVLENNVGTVLEWVLNIFERRPIKDLFPIIKSKKINFIARSPLCHGLINPSYIKNYPCFDSNDFRSTLPDEWITWVINNLRNYHSNINSEAELVKNALLFCSQFKEVNATILGIKSQKQLEHYINISRNTETTVENNQLLNIPSFYPKWA